jgi:hypothetical protein
METDSTIKIKKEVAYLNQKLHSLHMSNSRYWQEETPNTRARGLHQMRQDRLEEIRSELAQLCALPSPGEISDPIGKHPD